MAAQRSVCSPDLVEADFPPRRAQGVCSQEGGRELTQIKGRRGALIEGEYYGTSRCTDRPLRLVHITAPASAGVARAVWQIVSACSRSGCGEYRQLFTQLFRAAMWADSSLPVRRAHQHFAVLLAATAVKFVNRHGPIIVRSREGTTRFHTVRLDGA